jgi:hypothetical protein
MQYRSSFFPTILSIALAGALLFLPGCDSAGTGSDDGEDGRPDGAVLIAERFNTPDGRVSYMGAFPGLPNEPVDVSELTELGPSGKAFACGENAFFYNSEASTITKYNVGDDLSLTEAETIQLQQEGVEGFTAAHVCASETKAYTFHRNLGRAVEWNPEDMTIVEAFDVPVPDVDPSLEVSPTIFEPYPSGDLVYFPVRLLNYSNYKIAPKTVVGVFDTQEQSMTFAEDDRCLSSTTGGIDEDGNFYKMIGWQVAFSIYSDQENLPPACILRINAGEKSIDSDFVAELPDENLIPGPMFWIEGESALTIAVDSTTAPESVGDFWSSDEVEWTPKAINFGSGELSDYEGISKGMPENSRTLSLDGDSYYQFYTYDEEGLVERVDVMRLTENGPAAAFTVKGGDVLTLQRLW